VQQLKTEDFVKYEADEMTTEEEVAFIQQLIDTGMAWTLQGSYGRTAESFIKVGWCHKKGENVDG
jgi:hypothetical protein